MTPMESDQKRILGKYKDLMAAILDYQMEHGTDSIRWSVNVGFAIKEVRP